MSAVVVSVEDITSDLDAPVCECGRPSVVELAWDEFGAERQGPCLEHLLPVLDKAFAVAATSFLPPTIHPINKQVTAWPRSSVSPSRGTS